MKQDCSWNKKLCVFAVFCLEEFGNILLMEKLKEFLSTNILTDFWETVILPKKQEKVKNSAASSISYFHYIIE